MEDKEFFNKWVYLTPHLEHWLKEINSNFNIPMVNRLAKVIKVFDWDTKEGKILLEAREKTGKWANLVSKDFKFVLKIYYPDMILKDKKGITAEEVMPRFYPGSKLEMFCEVPEWFLKDIKSNRKVEEFSLIQKSHSKKQ
jgi:hypothetical protein